MSDAELSDVADDDDIVREYENEDENAQDGNNDMENTEQYFNVSNEEVKEDDENAKQKVDPPAAKKRTRKLVVLNTERLKGKKGVHTIEKLFEGFKFKGKGKEKEDLDRVMKRMEYWGYRLFPKLDFDDFLAKCEHLGHKKDLQTHLKKYRLGMITADYNAVTQNDIIEDEIEDDPNVMRIESELLAEIANDDFQRLYDEVEQATDKNP